MIEDYILDLTGKDEKFEENQTQNIIDKKDNGYKYDLKYFQKVSGLWFATSFLVVGLIVIVACEGTIAEKNLNPSELSFFNLADTILKSNELLLFMLTSYAPILIELMWKKTEEFSTQSMISAGFLFWAFGLIFYGMSSLERILKYNGWVANYMQTINTGYFIVGLILVFLGYLVLSRKKIKKKLVMPKSGKRGM